MARNFEIKIPVREVSLSELDESDRALVEAAKEQVHNSYAPYSRFHVGAAILLEDGTVVTGANQENAAYPSGTCAERTAAYYASAAHPGKKFRKIAVAAWTRLHADESASFEDCFQRDPISPCGACRQALLEYEALHGPIEVLLYGADRTWIFNSVASLLPLTFTKF